MKEMWLEDLINHTDTVNSLLARYGVKFGIYKNNTFHEQLFPFDSIPRIIEKADCEGWCDSGGFYFCFKRIHGGM